MPCPEDVTGYRQVTVGVLVTVRPDCGEASAVWVNNQEATPSPDGFVALTPDEQVEIDHQNAVRALSRAKTNLRRYCTANKLQRMWTLTFADEHWDPVVVIGKVNRFVGVLRDHLGGAFPYVYVLELHPGGHGYHVHLLLQKRFIDWDRFGYMWGHGVVQYSDGNKSINREVGGRAQARMAASYLVKYASKDWDYGSGRHRYERSQGFNERTVRRLFQTFQEAMYFVVAARGGESPVIHHESYGMPDWTGPPFLWQAW